MNDLELLPQGYSLKTDACQRVIFVQKDGATISNRIDRRRNGKL